jgi:DNA repair exonuclease SbcCD ATPase subunit
MTYLLFLLSIGLATALALVIKQLQERKKNHAVDQQKLKEADKRLQEADRKYGGLISREDTARELDTQITVLTNRLKQLEKQAKAEEQELSAKISVLSAKLQGLEEQEIVEAFGFYESKYDFQEADEYKQRLDKIRAQQKQMIKSKQAAVCHTEWSVGGSAKEGKKMTDNFLKLVLRAFNGECDASVVKVKYNNVQTMENRIRKTYEDLNKLSQTTHCDITSHFLDLKLQELWLTHEYQERKYQEQEEQRIIREQMREEEKALRELEKAKQDAEREERRYQEALEKARRDVESATGKAQEKLFSQIEELQKRLAEAEANKERAISQAQLTKSGHVYIISNIGSFGEDIYKIGMTRRLEPMDRVKELGDASVPFPFDVHAMIFCENAPELESRLHKRFNNRRMNKENGRKEFFRVSLDEIVRVVRETDQELKICKSEVIFTKIAEATDYRKTLARERQDEVAVAI